MNFLWNFLPMERQHITNSLFSLVEKFATPLNPPLAPYPSSKNTLAQNCLTPLLPELLLGDGDRRGTDFYDLHIVPPESLRGGGNF